MNTLKVVTTIVGIVMSLGYYPQAYRIWKMKSSEEISLINYLILSIGTAVWFVYGLILHDLVVSISFAFGVVGSWLMLFLILKYRK